MSQLEGKGATYLLSFTCFFAMTTSSVLDFSTHFLGSFAGTHLYNRAVMSFLLAKLGIGLAEGCGESFLFLRKNKRWLESPGVEASGSGGT